MSEVLFSEKIETIIKNIDFNSLGKKVALKVHFGEKGCTTYLPASLVKKVYDAVKKKGRIVHLVDCNVLYKGARTTTTEHLKTAKGHGFNFAPVKILDGEMGQDTIKINDCLLGKGLKSYDSLIVLTHFKGHIETGFGGALKNLGMGLGSRAGKLDMHSLTKPSVKKNKCTACGLCVSECPVNAISMNCTAFINRKECIGCAMCIAVCPVNAISIPWAGRLPHKVQERICDYCKAVNSLFKRIIYINAVISVTNNCDCMGYAQTPAVDDIGFLSSEDIVSIDSASKDLVVKKGMRLKGLQFKHMLDYAEKIGLGSKKYKLNILK